MGTVGTASGDRVGWPPSLGEKQAGSKCLEQRQELVRSEPSSLWDSTSHRRRRSASLGNLQDTVWVFRALRHKRRACRWSAARFHLGSRFILIKSASFGSRSPSTLCRRCTMRRQADDAPLSPVRVWRRRANGRKNKAQRQTNTT